ncbi:Autophagy protein 7 [Coemansia aciculifera]|uniref:Ubiquitin-like modifier-activating enzyme ATG7 n=1 Tax=Coemansia aciculifera TaxID=417176 RepID=A0A9W8IQJ2_9FUNG|nr:Autophagy protein 7 [Coemansia aciculifera]
MSEILRFEPFSSAVEPEFWASVAHHKLHTARLDTAARDVQGSFGCGRRHTVRSGGESGQTVAVPARLRVGAGEEGGANGGDIVVGGRLHNTNTVEDFKRLDKGALLREAGAAVLEAIQSGRASEDPSLLWGFVVVSFADLKRYRFWHWFGFPAVMADPADTVWSAAQGVGEAVGSDDSELAGLVGGCAQFVSETRHGAFLACRRNGSWQVRPLSAWGDCMAGASSGDVLVGFVDPSSHGSRPGWPLRNLLAWVRHQRLATRRVRVLCFRDGGLRGASGAEMRQRAQSVVVGVDVAPGSEALLVSGWERDAGGRAAARVADLSAAMDGERLAAAALDLNLQLMRWRLAPGVDVARMAAQRVLLVGAGTLGAYAARALLAWGVRRMTFVDSGRVSFSNPARQPLYDFADSLDGGRPKADAAAAAMRRIFPGVDARAAPLQVPMPAHGVGASEVAATRAAAAELDALVAAHDAVFLLTDSRESRWLPAMLGALHGKVVVCVALGFDSYVAMRHGTRRGSAPPQLGCYFCNDVVAPADSLSDRSLDQQCTVTRPGLAPIAAGTAVELLAAVVQHPLGGLAPPPPPTADGDAVDSAVFGAPPHQLRGYLAGFRQHAIVGQAYDRCTACSDVVLDAYRQHGFDFLLRVFNNTVVDEAAPHVPTNQAPPAPDYSYLETLTGLAALHRQTDDIMADIEWSEDGDEGSDAGFEQL